MAVKIQLRRGTAAQWTSANPILAAGEPAVETDTGRLKVGNGATAWADLDYYDEHVADAVVASNDLVTSQRASTLLMPVPAHPRVILFGTSLEAQNGIGMETVMAPGGLSQNTVSAIGWFNWCNGYLHSRLVMVRNAGVGGNTYAQMLARMNADVLSYASDWVFMGGPVNDVAGGRTAAAIIADCNAMVDTILNSGRRLLILTAAGSTSYDTPTKRAVLAEVNTHIRSLPSTRPGVIVADAWAEVADPATDFPATGMARDSVHWTPAGAQRVGHRAAKAFAAGTGGVNAELFKRDVANATSAIGNPTFEGGTGWTPDAGVTATYSGDRASLRYASPAVSDAGLSYYEPASPGLRWAVGDTLRARATIRWRDLALKTGGNLVWFPMVWILLRRVDGTFQGSYAGMHVASGVSPSPAGWEREGEVTFMTNPAVVEADVDRLYVRVGFAGAATGLVEVRDLKVYKVV